MFWRRSSPVSVPDMSREIQGEALSEALGGTITEAVKSAAGGELGPAEVEWTPVPADESPAAEAVPESEPEAATADPDEAAAPLPATAGSGANAEPPPELRITWHGPYGINDNGPPGIDSGLYVIAGRSAGSRQPVFQYESVQRVEMRRADVVREAFRRAKGDCDLLTPSSVRIWIGVSDQAHGDHSAHLLTLRQAVAFALQPQLSESVGAAEAPARDFVVRNICVKPPGRLDPETRGFWPEIIAYAAAPEPKVTLRWSQQDEYLNWCRLAREVRVKPEDNAPAPLRWLPASLFAAALAIVAALLVLDGKAGNATVARDGNGETVIEQQLRAALKTLSGELDAAKLQIASLLLDKNGLIQRIEALTADASTNTRRLTEKDEQLNALQARLALSNTKTNEAASGAPARGLELQSCWQRQGQRTVPVYRVEIHDDGFVVAPAWDTASQSWPEEFQGAMSGFAPAPIIEQTTLDPGAFAERMRPYYDFGTSGANCRFFVDVYDVASNKNSWKSGLELVERFFYKRLV